MAGYDARDVGLRLIPDFFTASIGLVAVILLRIGGDPEMFRTRLDVLLTPSAWSSSPR
jgi:hypothetical protein